MNRLLITFSTAIVAALTECAPPHPATSPETAIHDQVTNTLLSLGPAIRDLDRLDSASRSNPSEIRRAAELTLPMAAVLGATATPSPADSVRLLALERVTDAFASAKDPHSPGTGRSSAGLLLRCYFALATTPPDAVGRFAMVATSYTVEPYASGDIVATVARHCETPP